MGTPLMTKSSFFGARLLIPLFVIVAAGLAAHAFVSYRSTKQHFLAFVSGEAERSSGLIRRSIQDAMLLHKLDDVQATIERLALEPEIEAIRIYDKRGRIALSSDRKEIGQLRAVANGPCLRCHDGTTPAPLVARVVERDMVRYLSAIENQPACKQFGCHDLREDQKVLGVLSVKMSLVPFENALTSARSYLMWTTFVLVIVVGFITALVGQRLLRYQQLSDWSHRLEERVAEETTQLKAAQRQVLHMEKMASLGKLSATVAHELNNPISGMLTYARLVERELENQPLQPEVRAEIERYLHLVQRECTRCGGIVHNLLAFSRRSGTTEMRTVDANEIVERSLMLIRHHMEMKGIYVHTQLLRDNAEIIADPAELEQALVALFVNAIEAMRQGGQLDVRLDGTTTEITIDVGDTGIGIPADVLPLIFEPFYSTKTDSGSGLGLAVVYGIVRRHGGTIQVESEVDVGTTFHIRLPRRPRDDSGGFREGSETLQAAGVEQ